METAKRGVFRRIGRRRSVFDRITSGCGGESSSKVSVFDRINLPTKGSVFDRIGAPADRPVKDQVCRFWVQGRCTRNRCRFLHSNPEDHPRPAAIFEEQESPDQGPKRKRPSRYDDLYDDDDLEPKLKRPNLDAPATSINKVVKESEEKPLSMVAKTTQLTEMANPSSDQEAKPPTEVEVDLHCTGCGITLLHKLKCHNAAVTGVCQPSGSNNFYSLSRDGNVCSWDRDGKCLSSVQLGKETRCLLSEGGWFFVGLDDCVNAYCINTREQLVLGGLNAPVCSMAAGDFDKLICGLQDGSICVWKGTQLLATLKGHSLCVSSLCISAATGSFYSASKDKTIRVWDLKTFECLTVLNAHSNAVTSLAFWGTHMLSGSLDNTIKVWASSQDGSLKVVHEVGTEFGVAGLSCKNDDLLCSLNDNSVRLYSIPSFSERGRILSASAVTATAIGGSGLLYTGDATGLVGVLQLDDQPPSEGAAVKT